MRFRFPNVEILEAAVVMWHEAAKPDVRLDQLNVSTVLDTEFEVPGEESRRIAILAIDDLNEPENPGGLLHIYMRLDVGNEADDGTPLPNTWAIITMNYEYDDRVRAVKFPKAAQSYP